MVRLTDCANFMKTLLTSLDASRGRNSCMILCCTSGLIWWSTAWASWPNPHWATKVLVVPPPPPCSRAAMPCANFQKMPLASREVSRGANSVMTFCWTEWSIDSKRDWDSPLNPHFETKAPTAGEGRCPLIMAAGRPPEARCAGRTTRRGPIGDMCTVTTACCAAPGFVAANLKNTSLSSTVTCGAAPNAPLPPPLEARGAPLPMPWANFMKMGFTSREVSRGLKSFIALDLAAGSI
mmetsp:Transcript_99815/g.277764  ORF Transcript_99815/g.277764 Transcript_99815/m.277764 type:complete len:237 (+) Transcript_99815:193-903(+)